MKDLKYLAAFIIPLLAALGLKLGGFYSFMAVGFAFGLIPLLEPLLPESTANLSQEEAKSKLSSFFFDVLLYLNLPLVYGVMAYFVFWLHTGNYSAYEILGNVLSVGTLLGANGINVAHELGHRFNKAENILAQALLLPSFYMHFFIEHNLGHHKNVATAEDPSSARFNEPVYVFWVRSTFQSYAHAWSLEHARLKRLGSSALSLKNRMIWFTIFQLVYVIAILTFASVSTALLVIVSGVIGFLLLETINYIEHYGLQRKKLKSGKYERVRPKHSWNSNHELGRIVLYELTRHSDHHFISSKKYQVLEHHEESPQLPFGYPTSMLASLVPPLWFRLMNMRVKNFNAL
ncbi:MAG: alkane 1-monooxygenase [Flavobacteriales bacterium]